MIRLTASRSGKHALTIDEVVRGLEHLPSAPRVLPRLKHLLCDVNTAMSEVVAMVRLDPGIAARVLQFGNSAYFSHGVRCYTVEEAVARVGYDQIYELVATAVSSQVLSRPLVTYGMDADGLWARSIASALAAECIAESVGADRNISYTVGLLHALGMIAIDEWALRNEPDLRFTVAGFPLDACEEERAVLGFHQAEAGATLLRHWAFPAAMSEPVRWQYLPSGTSAHFSLSMILHAAKWVSAAALSGNTQIPLPPAVQMQRMGISAKLLHGLVPEIRTRFEGINCELTEEEDETVPIAFPAGTREIPMGSTHRPSAGR